MVKWLMQAAAREEWLRGGQKQKPQVPFGIGVENGDPSEIRTPDTLIKSQVLYRLS